MPESHDANDSGSSSHGHVDIHCHVLPGLDDGPADMATSVAMANLAAEDGTTHLVATPHSNFQWRYIPEKNQELIAELQRQAPQPRILLGCDFHLSYENIQDALISPRKYSLNGSRWQLVEFADFFNADAMATALRQLLGVGLVPVLTHPERNPTFQENRQLAHRYVQMGCVVQITAGVFSGDFGSTALKTAEDMFELDLVHVIASDGHSTERRKPRLSRARQWIAQRYDDEIARMLVADNPWAMINDLPKLPYMPSVRPEPRRRKFWAFLKS
jgi:protein-tyrosine phosphatase